MHKRFALLAVLPAVLLGQSVNLSNDARKLLKRPHLGNAQLTLVDGRAMNGRVVRITDAFIAFATNTYPPVCENVELSKIATVQWVRMRGQAGAGTIAGAGYVVLLSALLAPSYVANTVANPFKRISPPLTPLSGTWRSSGQPGTASESSLVFKGTAVRYTTATSKSGRWSITQDSLHLAFDGEPERIALFRFDCSELILENPDARLKEWNQGKRTGPPIIGDWHGSNYSLDLRPNGTVTRQDLEDRTGTFENNATGVKIHWPNATAPGGAEWIGRIERRHIVLDVGGVMRVYRYVPPGLQMDL